jgi:serine/threonine-protein kinase
MDDTSFGKYRLLAELGHGGMADVFLAVAEGPAGSGFSKLTVIKRLRKNLAEDPEFVTMLMDEARIAARLNHPNVVQTNEVGHVGTQYFIAMEHLDGQPLHRIQLRASAPDAKPFPKALQYLVLCDALAGLHHAHELKDYDGTSLEVVHRDVTPHNLFVTYDGQVKVVDFGIAKAVGRASETRQGLVKGKVRYMGPEQGVGGKIDRRADLYAVGIMLWEMATGRRMWKDMEEGDILRALVGGDVMRSPREAAPDADVPEAIDKICQKALARWVEDRYATAEELRSDIEHYLAESGQLLDARRKLGPYVAELFSDDRKEMKGVLESQLAQLASKTKTEFKTVFIPLESTPNLTPSSAHQRLGRAISLDDTKSAVNQGTVTETAPVQYFRERPTRSKRVVAAVAVVGGLVLAATLFFALGRKHEPAITSSPDHDALPPPSDLAVTVSAPSTPPSSATSSSPAIGASTVSIDTSSVAAKDAGAAAQASTAVKTPAAPAQRPGTHPASRPSAGNEFSGFGGRK